MSTEAIQTNPQPQPPTGPWDDIDMQKLMNGLPSIEDMGELRFESTLAAFKDGRITERDLVYNVAEVIHGVGQGVFEPPLNIWERSARRQHIINLSVYCLALNGIAWPEQL